MNKRLKSNIMLLLAALIWGVAFVAQKSGMEFVGPYTFNCVRCFIGSLVLIPVIKLFDKPTEADLAKTQEQKKADRKVLALGGLCCGLALFGGTTFQQKGLLTADAGKAGFITALYIVLVPVVSLFFKKKSRPAIWIGVVLGAIGLYLLCVPAGGSFSSINKGDILLFCCAIAFTAHILVIDYFSPKTSGVKLSCIQFAVCGVLSAIPMFILEDPQMSAILDCWLPILYTGVLSSGAGYTLQIVGQKNTDPTVASLILSLESVFALLAGIVVLNEILTLSEALGCLIMFTAIIITQLPERKVKACGRLQ